MRNGSLWSNVVFAKEVIFHLFDLETSELDFEVLKSSIWKHTTSCDKGVFSCIIMSQLGWPIGLKCSQVCYFMHMLSTPSKKTGLWQLPTVSSVFNMTFEMYALSCYIEMILNVDYLLDWLSFEHEQLRKFLWLYSLKTTYLPWQIMLVYHSSSWVQSNRLNSLSANNLTQCWKNRILSLRFVCFFINLSLLLGLPIIIIILRP